MNTTEAQDYDYLIMQIRGLLNKHLHFNDGSPESGILWRIQGLINDELEYKNECETKRESYEY